MTTPNHSCSPINAIEEAAHAALERKSQERKNTPTPKMVVERITAYLASGGLWNPEYADHNAVRDLLIDARDDLAAAQSELVKVKAENSKLRSALEIVHFKRKQWQ